ncbi:MAG: prepilin-type N-terminal cleavage/methylation domain-containing protein [Candidatus Spyradosoma sp.]
MRSRVRRAFTLFEVVVAVALAGVLLTAAAGVVMNVVRVWEKSGDVASLDRHLSGLGRFLGVLADAQRSLQIAQTSEGKNVVGCAWTQPPGLDETFPRFEIVETFPLFALDEKPQPELEAWLFWNKTGLWLISQTARQKNEDENAATWTLLSPFLESASVHAWDAESGAWESVDSVDESVIQSRAIRLRLRFRDGRVAREHVLALSGTETPGGAFF